MCKHQFIKTAGKKTKSVTYYCIHCAEKVVEMVIPYDKHLMANYKKIIDEQIEFTHVLKIK